VGTRITRHSALLPRLGWVLVCLAAADARPVGAQQPFIDVIAATQVATGDRDRLGGQSQVAPNLGIRMLKPVFRSGTVAADLDLTTRADKPVLGQGVFSIDDLKAGGLTWTLGVGDLSARPVVADFGFSNLFAPPVTFIGSRVAAFSPKAAIGVSGGRVTALRNIFGTDTFPVGQDVYQASATYRRREGLDLNARGSHVRGEGAQAYTTRAETATNLGGGARFRPHAWLELVADGGYTRFRRPGSSRVEQSGSGIAGALLTLPGGWLQVNTQYLPLGTFPVFNYPYLDRGGVFAAGEIDLGRVARLAAGAEWAKTVLDSAANAEAGVGLPPGTQTRGYTGLSLRVADRSSLSVRAEVGGREIRPSRFGAGFTTDSTVLTAEWHGAFRTANTFLRYEHRNSADLEKPEQGFLQDDSTAQAYVALGNRGQVFVQAMFSRRHDQGGEGQTLWQAGGGAQLSLPRSYLRLEANLSRTADRITGAISGRQMLSAGFSTRIARRTHLSLDCHLDHAPLAGMSGNPWITRTMIRVTRSFPFGSSRSVSLEDGTPRGGPSGQVGGIVFVDWDGDGQYDPGEEPAAGVGVTLGRLGSATSGTDGRFSFTGVPVGSRDVALDLSTLPASYDPPAEMLRTVGVARHQKTEVAFGLLPLGSIQGAVYQDTDKSGDLSESDLPLDGAVVILDGGARTEVSRGGRLVFDEIRLGPHTVSVLVDSLPDGSLLGGPSTSVVELVRGQTPNVVFLVSMEKRPEVRKVFPPKKRL
jgi:hypothetical protein